MCQVRPTSSLSPTFRYFLSSTTLYCLTMLNFLLLTIIFQCIIRIFHPLRQFAVRTWLSVIVDIVPLHCTLSFSVTTYLGSTSTTTTPPPC
ncbi:hypothetical protein V8E53_002910 [Lactarius tabidus]